MLFYSLINTHKFRAYALGLYWIWGFKALHLKGSTGESKEGSGA